MSVRMKVMCVAIAATSAIACGYKSPMSPSPMAVGATIQSDGFTPNPVSVPAGATVTWTNGDSVAHGVVGSNPAFDSGSIAPGGMFSQTFPAAGTFTYHDAANPGMVGVVTVTAPTSGSPSYDRPPAP
jgi:plastocyanin